MKESAKTKAQLQAELAELRQLHAQLTTQNRLLTDVLAAGQQLRLNLDLPTLLPQICAALTHSLGFSVAVINLLDRSGRRLRISAHQGVPAEHHPALAAAVYDWRTFAATLLQDRFYQAGCYFIPSGAIDWTTDFQGVSIALDADGGAAAPGEADQWQPDDVLLAPLVRHTDQVLGVISLDRPVDGRRPTRLALQALHTFADLVAVAVENAQLHQQALETARRRETLYQAMHQLGASVEIDQISSALHAAAAQVMPVEAVVIGLLAEDRTGVDLVYLYDEGQIYPRERQPLGFGLSGYVIASGQSVCDDDLNDSTVQRPFDIVDFGVPDAGRPVAALAVPMRLRGHVIGMVSVQSSVRAAYGAEEQELLEALAVFGAAAYENARLYNAVQRHAELLERRVADRTLELTRAYEQLQELDRLKDQFVSRISHELRTPLANIKLYLSLLEHGRPEKRADYQTTLQHEAIRLNALIEDLLDISRLDMGQTPVNLAAGDLNRLIADLKPDRLSQAASRGLMLIYDLTPDLPRAWFDLALLRQVLDHLLNNAFNYTPSGGKIVCQTAATVEARHTWVTFAVTDTGPGIDAQERARLFERFYRGKAARDYRVPGTGLGLAICREIMNRLGGRITLDSQPGVGTTFTIWLRAADDLASTRN